MSTYDNRMRRKLCFQTISFKLHAILSRCIYLSVCSSCHNPFELWRSFLFFHSSRFVRWLWSLFHVAWEQCKITMKYLPHTNRHLVTPKPPAQNERLMCKSYLIELFRMLTRPLKLLASSHHTCHSLGVQIVALIVITFGDNFWAHFNGQYCHLHCKSVWWSTTIQFRLCHRTLAMASILSAEMHVFNIKCEHLHETRMRLQYSIV